MTVSPYGNAKLVFCTGPGEGLGIFIVDPNVLADSRFQFSDTTKDSAPDTLISQLGKPAFHQVDPRTIGGREVRMEARALSKPLPNQGGFVRSVVVRDDVNVHFGRCLRFNPVQEPAELGGTMAPMKLAEDAAGLQLQSGNQRRVP